MMLCTVTCAPPSWAARLPQKFSAATTVIVDASPVARPPADVAQAPSPSPPRPATMTVATSMGHQLVGDRAAARSRTSMAPPASVNGTSLLETESIIK